MNQSASTTWRWILRVGGASLLGLLAVLAVQLLSSAPAAAQDGGAIDKPVLSVVGSPGGTATFTWAVDGRADSYQVATTSTTDCTNTQSGRTECVSTVVGTDICVSVRGVAGAIQGTPSEWRCVTDDPFLLDNAASYVEGQFALGVVEQGAQVPDVPGSPSCIVDLSYYPARYLCMSEAVASDSIDAIAAASGASDRVFWIGDGGSVPVEDFAPQTLPDNVFFDDPITTGSYTVGGSERHIIVVGNPGPLSADGVGYWFQLQNTHQSAVGAVDGDSTECQRQGAWLYCFVGDLAVDATSLIQINATFREGVSEDFPLGIVVSNVNSSSVIAQLQEQALQRVIDSAAARDVTVILHAG